MVAEAQLAPAAGSGLGKKVAEALLARPQFVDEMATAASEALTATQRFWSKEDKDWEVVPDYKTRLTAFQMIMAHLEGEPIKRIVTASLGNPGGPGPDLDSQLAASPAMRAAMRRRLEKADRAAAARAKQKGAPVIEMEP